MREIKFRAWDGKKMDYDPVIYGSHETGECWPNSAFEDRQRDGIIFMRYTGLKDKNGKEIYEGDILRRWTVAKAQSFMVHPLTPVDRFYGQYPSPQDDDWISHTEEYEVIGNIYENPKLLPKPLQPNSH